MVIPEPYAIRVYGRTVLGILLVIATARKPRNIRP